MAVYCRYLLLYNFLKNYKQKCSRCILSCDFIVPRCFKSWGFRDHLAPGSSPGSWSDQGWAGTGAHGWAQLCGVQGSSGLWGAGGHRAVASLGVALGCRWEPQEESGTVRAGHDPGACIYWVPSQGKEETLHVLPF